jgi:hypothetical protein
MKNCEAKVEHNEMSGLDEYGRSHIVREERSCSDNASGVGGESIKGEERKNKDVKEKTYSLKEVYYKRGREKGIRKTEISIRKM